MLICIAPLFNSLTGPAKTLYKPFQNLAVLWQAILSQRRNLVFLLDYAAEEEVRRSLDWLLKCLIKVGARVSYHAGRWYVRVDSAFPLAHHYRAVLARGS